MQATLEFERERETRNTIRYAEKIKPGQEPLVRTLYVAKGWANGADRLTVTITKVPAEYGDAA